MSTYFYIEQVRKDLDGKIRKIETQLTAGKASSFERYKELCGEIAGIKQALDTLINVAKTHGDILQDEE